MVEDTGKTLRSDAYRPVNTGKALRSDAYRPVNTGKAIRSDASRPVNTPQPVSVEEDSNGLPRSIKTPGRQPVKDIEDRWRIDDEWWRRETVSRLYYSVRVSSGQRLMLYKDLVSNCWYRQSY